MRDSITLPTNSNLYNLEEIVNDLPQYANLPTTTNQNLHTSSTPQIPGDIDQTEREKGDDGSVPGCLPEYNSVYKPSEIKWGKQSDGNTFIIRPQP